MRRMRCVVTAVVALSAMVLAVLPVGPALAGDGTGAGRSGVGPAGGGAPDADGPYGVGLTTFTVEDPARPGRVLTFDAWYPTDPGTATGSPAALDLLVTELALPGVRRDAGPAQGGGFPLVVFSHGSGGIRFQSWFLLQAMASHGYVVVAPDHAGNTSFDTLGGTTDPFPVVARNRPRDVSFAIDLALARSADPADLLAGTVDGDRIAVAGHSFGGFTALAVAGGYQDFAPDERVDAIIPIAAASSLLTEDELGSIDVPTMLLSGTDDVTVPLAAAAERPWAEIPARPAWRVDVHAAGHNSFTNVCDLLAALQGAGLPPVLLGFLVSSAEEGCGPDLIPIEEAHELTARYVLSFLRTTVGHDARWHHLLSPRWAERTDLPVTVLHRPGPLRRAA